MLSLAILLATLAAERVGLVLRIALGESAFNGLVRSQGGVASLVTFGSVSLVAVALIWFLPRLLSVPTLLAAAIVMMHSVMRAGWPDAAMLLGLAALTAVGPQRPPRSWLWLTAVLPAAELIGLILPGVDDRTAVPVALAVMGGAALLWAGIDARPAFAVAALLAALGLLTGGAQSARADVVSTAELWAAAGLAMVALVRLHYPPRPARN